MANKSFLKQIERSMAASARHSQQAAARREREKAAATRREVQEQKRLEREALARSRQQSKEATSAYVAAREAEVTALNEALAERIAAVESILAAAMEFDSWFDLTSLHVTAEHPPFPRTDLEEPTPAPEPITAPPEPVFTPPVVVSGLGNAFGGGKRYQKQAEDAYKAFTEQWYRWQAHTQQVPTLQLQQLQAYQARETERLNLLAQAQQAYAADCAERDRIAAEQNAELETVIRGLAQVEQDAVEAYFTLVLNDSGYPEDFQVEFDPTFDTEANELLVNITAPPPSALPQERAFKYVKSGDEVTSTSNTQRHLRDLYESALCQTAVRAIHEVVEADRNQIIKTISVTISAEQLSAATGLVESAELLAVAADRARFEAFNLTKVTPHSTIEHLGGQLSKDAYNLVPIDETRGVRRTGA
jgi:restriction system protein